MVEPKFLEALNTAEELEITVTGRKSGRSFSTPVWFVHGGGRLYLVPVRGSDSEWYRNVLVKPSIRAKAKGIGVIIDMKPITDTAKVSEVVEKFRAKYGADQVKKYYSKLDVALEASL